MEYKMNKKILAFILMLCVVTVACKNIFAEKCGDFTIEELALKLENHSLLVYKNGNITLKCPQSIIVDSKHFINSSSHNGNCLHIFTISFKVS